MVQPGVSALGKKNRTTGFPRNCFRDTGLPFSSGKVNSGALSLTCMDLSPFRSSLYRRGWRAVTWVVLITAGVVWAQFARKTSVSKGPRALGLLVMPPKGKPRLIPVAIMVDGKFYDAGAYKADPVPMALDPGTVYEAERTGASLGLFTINQVLQQKNNWLAEGTYHAIGEKVASSAHTAESKPREETDEGPPKLRRPGSEPPKPPSPPPGSKPASPPSSAGGSSAKATPPAPKPAPQPEDPNIPRLRRGIPEPSKSEEEENPSIPPLSPSSTTGKAGAAGKSTSGAATTAPEVQTVPAISDAGGPEPRPYTYAMSPGEELGFRTKMLAMAGDELRKQEKEFEPQKPAPSARAKGRPKVVPQPAQATFDDVQLHAFDISSSNEPVLVLTATAHPPKTAEGSPKLGDFYVTLVAGTDIYGELRKLFSQVADSEELDVSPRMQLIDVVDADGDGRGELLFRQTSDGGSTYAIYRVTPDRLWPLYEGTPQ